MSGDFTGEHLPINEGRGFVGLKGCFNCRYSIPSQLPWPSGKRPLRASNKSVLPSRCFANKTSKSSLSLFSALLWRPPLREWGV